MILIRQFSDEHTIAEEKELDELDFKLIELYLKQYLMDPTTYNITLKRFYRKKIPTIQEPDDEE